MKLTVMIESAELKYKQILEDFFISFYNDDSLPSHGLDHHRRVWSYAREMLLAARTKNHPHSPTPAGPEKLIIACYLHDIGMASDPGPEHGRISRDICKEFLLANRLDCDHFQDVLDAIHAHDKKDYESEGEGSELLSILSLADDLDAFGYTGIYRYAEIYLLRGVSPAALGYKVRENAARRFGHFVNHTELPDELVRKHTRRYQILDGFYAHYNKQAGNYDFGSDYPDGHCGLIQIFHRNIRNRMSLTELLKSCSDAGDDIIICSFYDGFRQELAAT